VRKWVETQGYVLCFKLAALRVDWGRPWGWLETLWTGIWYRYYCPYPIQNPWTARSCVEGGLCGCENKRFYNGPLHPNGERGTRT
jgi:hypothetical protein